jgi:hypothetical protein
MRKLQVLLVLISTAAFGQTDPPSRVARLNLIQGSVSFRPATVDEWAPATLNYPVHTGDYLWADQVARAELHVGSTAIRMDQTTAISVVNLNDELTQLSLTSGALNVHIRYLGENENFEVDTPNVSVTLLRPGDYRINADGDNNMTAVVVRTGDAEVTAGQAGAFQVRNGQMARLSGMDNVQQELSGAPRPDAFDAWAEDRDMREDRATVSSRYVPREMVGYEDLDANGHWVNVAPYGMVWQPNVVAVGWAPYRQGHWAWVEPWGWTWIDDMPWGFAPFHYGRWAFTGGGWYWVPGVVTVRPVYSPALVAFVGGGGIGVGVAAWFPLGPGEVYRPAYPVSEVYVRRVNVAYVRDVTVINRVEVNNIYVNQRVVGAVTVVPHDVFVGARPVAVAAVAVRPEMIVSSRVVGFTAAVAPAPVSVLARPVGGGVVVRTPPAVIVQRTVVARTAPPPPAVNFAARQEALHQNPGRPLDQSQLNTLRGTQPARPQMVRTFGQPAPAQPGGFARPAYRPAEPGARPEPARPEFAPRPAERPMENARPAENPRPPARNDRPPSAVQPRPVEPAARPEPVRPPEPAARPAERPVENARPAEPLARPPARNDRPPSAVQPRPAEPQARPEPARPVENARPAEAPRNERQNGERKAEEKGKKNDRTEKK